MKNYIPLAPLRLILRFLLWIILLVSIMFSVLYFKHNPLLFSIGAVVLVLELIFEIIRFLKIKISLTSEYISTSNSFAPPTSRVQFCEKIDFKDIQNIRIISSKQNSLGKALHTGTLYSNTYKKYLEITLFDNSKKRILIDSYTKKQVLSILKHISKKSSINVNEIMKNWYTTYKEMNLKSNIVD